MNPHSEMIVLDQPQIDFSVALGIRRYDFAREVGKKERNGMMLTPAQSRRMSIVGCLAECAAYLWLKPILWNRWTDEREKLPDLDCFIDVKGREQPGDDIYVHEPDPPDWAFLLVSARQHPLYRVIGWQWAHDAQKPKWRDDKQRQPGEPVLYRITPPHRPAVELINVLWQREMVA
jgi:hypothetical protein